MDARAEQRERLIRAALDWNDRANSEGFAIQIPNTTPPLYVAFGAAERIAALIGAHSIEDEGGEPAANESAA